MVKRGGSEGCDRNGTSTLKKCLEGLDFDTMLINFCDGRSKELICCMGIDRRHWGFSHTYPRPHSHQAARVGKGWHHKKGARIWRGRRRWKSELLGHQDESGVHKFAMEQIEQEMVIYRLHQKLQDSLGNVSAVENLKVQLLKSFAQYSANFDSRVWKMDNKYIRGSKSTVCQNSSMQSTEARLCVADICQTMMVDLLAQINALKVRIKANRDKLEQLRPYLSIH